jgi:hypothetical protein
MHVRESEILEPVLDHLVVGTHDVNVAGKLSKRRDIEMVRMDVRNDDRVERRKLVGANRAPGAGDDGSVLEWIVI